MGDSPADRYERAHPGTGIPEAQKQERQERIDFKKEPRPRRRTVGSIVVPELPYKKETE